jgi:hypothetical protein
MKIDAVAAPKGSGFDLKNVAVELIPQSIHSKRAALSLEELEAVRTDRPMVPASKHGLETICGASCEIGAH